MSLLKRINALEPLWWSMFGLGGAVAAFILPAQIFIQGIAVPLGWVSPDWVSYEGMKAFLNAPLVKIYFLILIIPPLFHAAHRIRLTVEDLRVEALNRVLPLLCYGGSIVLSLAALILIFRIPS
jgi:fumarate reductase subunit D